MANTNNSQAADKAALEEMQKKLAEAEAKAKAAEEAVAAAESRAEDAEKKSAEVEAQLQALQTPAVEPKADKVKIKLPLERNSSNEDVQVFINGRQYIIQRGIEVEVPRGVAEILVNREKMLEVIDAFNKKNAQ